MEESISRTLPFAAIALAVAMLATATPTLAKAQSPTVVGTERMYFGAPGRVWTAGPWVHLRDLPLSGTFDFGTLRGTETQLVNAKLDPLTGDGIVWGSVTYTDSTAGITCSGVRQGVLDNYLITARIVASCSDGSRLRGTLQDTLVTFPSGSPLPGEVLSDFHGTLHRH